jgi:hypothetical protein
VAGPSTAVRMKPRTFAQDDRVWVGRSQDDSVQVGYKQGHGFLAAPELELVMRYNDFVRIAVTALIDTRNRVRTLDVL